MMEDKSISLIEMFLLTVYLGSIVYLIGLIIFIFLIYRKFNNKLNLVILSFVQLLLSIILSILIWRFWPLEIDIIQGLIFLPSICAEVISVLLLYLIIQGYKNRKPIN
ncbi:hypothetical protein JCM30204_29300 [Dysgonomonas termitidis]